MNKAEITPEAFLAIVPDLSKHTNIDADYAFHVVTHYREKGVDLCIIESTALETKKFYVFDVESEYHKAIEGMGHE